MVIHLKLYGGLEEYLPENRSSYPAETAEGSTIADVLAAFGVPCDRPRVLLVNFRHADIDHVLKDGDVLAVFPPVAGG